MFIRHVCSAIRPRGLAVVCCLAAVAAAGGCGSSAPPQFVVNFEGKKRSDITAPQLQGLVDATVAVWGTPDDPYVFPETGLDLQKIRIAAGPTSSDEAGRHRGLFREHCVHCHGITGDGDGPTALFLNPYPRDYRRGIFKFKSTERAQRPTVADLRRVIVDGVPGTAMPSFALLPEQEIEALVEYVRYLSMRGETELLLWSLIVDEELELPLARADVVDGALQPVIELWAPAEESVIVPPPRPAVDTPEALAASIAKGREVYLDQKRAQCTKCHGPTALGDGGEPVFDDWNIAKTGDWAKDRLEWSLPKQALQPRNLRLGIYRGGRRPVDVYRRIHAGISGTPMPAAGPSPGNAGVLTPEEIWNLVDYILSLPYDAPSRAEPQLAVDRPRL